MAGSLHQEPETLETTAPTQQNKFCEYCQCVKFSIMSMAYINQK